jgi:hypothetical protein
MMNDYFGGRPLRREVQMRVRAMVFSAPLLTAGMIASGAALAPVTDASAATVIVRQQPRAVAVQRPVVVQRPAVVQRPNVQRSFTQQQHNVVQPNAIQRVPRNPGLIQNRGNAQQSNQPFNNQQKIIQPGPGGMPRNAVVGGPVNGLRLGPGRPNGPTNVHLGPGPGGIPGMRPNFPVITAHNRFFPIARGQRFVWWGGYRRTFVPLAVLGVVVIGGSYWYPDGYVSVAQPLCTGLTPDGCQLNWRMVDFEDGGGVPQCVQYCPQVGPPPARVAELPPPLPPAPANGTCEMTIFADPNFGGLSAPTAENQATLSQAGWLNEISSVQVQSGTWEFYADENFGGASMRLTPGTYPNLAPEWTKRIGSFQCVEPSA